MAREKREIIVLFCDECKQKHQKDQRNYTTTRNKRIHPDKYELKKYCKVCRKHTLHKEK